MFRVATDARTTTIRRAIGEGFSWVPVHWRLRLKATPYTEAHDLTDPRLVIQQAARRCQWPGSLSRRHDC
jgi:hypothetical protein